MICAGGTAPQVQQLFSYVAHLMQAILLLADLLWHCAWLLLMLLMLMLLLL